MSEIVGKMWYDETGNLNSSMRALPWHLCARTFGDKLQLKVWTNEQDKQPSWSDPKFVREIHRFLQRGISRAKQAGTSVT